MKIIAFERAVLVMKKMEKFIYWLIGILWNIVTFPIQLVLAIVLLIVVWAKPDEKETCVGMRMAEWFKDSYELLVGQFKKDMME